MVSVRTSVPEDKTVGGFMPFVCLSVVGVGTAASRGWGLIAGGWAGGVAGAILNVATQYVYYHHVRSDPFANIIYLGPEVCLVVDLIAGSIIGSLLGSAARVAFWSKARVFPSNSE